jgi:hypothetical protein
MEDINKNNIKVYIPFGQFQDSLIEYASYVLYKQKIINNTNDNIITSFELPDYLFKKENDESVIYDYFNSVSLDDHTNHTEDENDKLLKLNPDNVAFQITEGKYSIPNETSESSIELIYEYSKEIHRSNILTPYKKVYLIGKKLEIQIFISNMSEYFNKNKDISEYFKIYIPNPKGYWDVLSKNKKRDINTVFIKNKDSIINDIDEFISSENDYKLFGHPYKRNYLFYGPPGNGKTSLISSIASKYNLNIYFMSFSISITDEIFKKLISGISCNSLLVIEDIDMLFDEKEKKQISISTVLNIMDGLAKKNRLISIMTTNHYDHLSDVFKRPGRIDMSVEFNTSDLEIFNQILNFLCTYKNESIKDEYHKLVEEFYNNIKHINPSCALVQKFIFENRKKTIEEIFSKKMITKFKELNIIYQNNSTEKKGISLYA